MRKILITGASGFLGRHVLDRIRLRERASVIGVGRSIPSFASDFDRFDTLDFQQPGAASALIESIKPDWIFHLAGSVKGSNLDLYQGNLMTSVDLLDAAESHCPKAKILLTGSAAEYGFSALNDGVPISEETPCHPAGSYATSKHAMTRHALDLHARRGMHLNIVRPFNLIGAGIPSSLLLGAILERANKAIAEGLPGIVVGNLAPERDFLSVTDAAEACVRVMERNIDGEIINLCSGIPTSIQWMVESALKCFPRNLAYEVDPSLVRVSDPKRVVGNNEKARRLLDFQPETHLNDALRSACEFALANQRKT